MPGTPATVNGATHVANSANGSGSNGIALAIRALSWMDIQPWHPHILTGEPRDRIRAENTQRNLARAPPSRESRGTDAYEGGPDEVSRQPLRRSA